MFSQRRFGLLALAALAIAIGLPFDALAHGISEADRQRMLSGGYLQYVGLGVTHMLTGYDHLLFLFGVVFFLSNFKDVAKFVTVFTIGHCITLVFATFFKITWNYYLVDAIIAISVIYKGFDNNGGFQKYFDMKSPNLLAAVFGFGLLHGFGLSTRLQQLPLGDDSTSPGYIVVDGQLAPRPLKDGRLQIEATQLRAVGRLQPVRVDPNGYIIQVGEHPYDQWPTLTLWLVVLAVVGWNLSSLAVWWRRRQA